MNLFGPKCPRCDERNDKSAEFCEHCGISMTAPRPAILKGNRWEAAPDEFAVFFKGRDLKGLFSKTLYIPAGMRAWILQDNRAEEIMEGEYTLQTLPERLNALFADKHTEILLSRGAAVAIPFRFDDIPSAELLQVTVETNIVVKLGDLAAFRNHFMLRPGAVSVPQLRDLLKDSVRQILVETLGGRRLEEMTGQGGLRQEIDRKLQAGLQHRFKDFGLAFDQADTLCVRHDRFDANRQIKGSLWLEYDEARQKAEHRQAIQDIYTQDEWAKIKAREEDLRRRYRSAELTQEEAEFAHVIRLRELALFEKVTEAKTREQAVMFGAREEVEYLEHQYQGKRREREKDVLRDSWQEEDAETAWRRTQVIARIRHETEIKVEQTRREEAETLERKRITNELEKIRVEGEIERARLIEDEDERKNQLAANAALLLKASLREQALLDARHQLAVDEVSIAGGAKKRESARIDAWEDKLLEEKMATVDRGITNAKEDDRLGRIKTLIELDEMDELATLRVDMKRKRKEQSLKDETEDRALERRFKEQREARAAHLEESNANIEHMRVMGSLPAETLIALADDPQKISTLAELATTKALGNMSSEQIQAILAAKTPVREMPAMQPAAPGTSAPDALLTEVRRSADQQLATFNAMLDRLDRSHSESQRALVEMGDKIKDAGVGVAQATGQRTAAHEAAPVHTQFASAPPPLSFKACPKCGRNNSHDARHCSGCGQSLL